MCPNPYVCYIVSEEIATPMAEAESKGKRKVGESASWSNKKMAGSTSVEGTMLKMGIDKRNLSVL